MDQSARKQRRLTSRSEWDRVFAQSARILTKRVLLEIRRLLRERSGMKIRSRHEMTGIMRRNFIFAGLGGAAALAASGQTVLAQTAQTGTAQLQPPSANADGLKPSDLHCPPDQIKTGSTDVVLPSVDGKLKTTTYIVCKKKSP